MNTGAKIAIGCTAAVLLAGLAVLVAVGGAVWFVRDKVQDFSADMEEIEALEREADSTPFARPADGVVAEERLQAFIEVRRRVHDVYQEYRDLLEPEAGRGPDLSVITRSASMIRDLRMGLAQARADVGMSADEYAFMVEQVYRTLWSEHLERGLGEEGAAGALAAAQQQLRDAQEAGGLSDEQRAQLEAQIEQLRESAQSASDAMAELEVPEANRELFERYREELERYSMAGLEAVGL